MTSHLAIDALTVRNGRVFGWGWFLDTDALVATAALELPLLDGGVASIACVEGATRADVAAVFPDVAHAGNAGFMLMGSLAGTVDFGGSARFVARLRDGRMHEFAIPVTSLPLQDRPGRGLRGIPARLREIGLAAAARAVGRRAQASVRGMAESVAFYLAGWIGTPLTVVFDHALGGGANAFRDARIESLLAEGRAVLRVSPDVARLDYVLSLMRPGRRTRERRAPTVERLLHELSRFRIATIEVNNLVSFDDPLAIVRWCVDRRAAGGELVFYLHDFHSVCPAFTLIDADGRYCGVPAPDACRACLPRNAANLLGFPAPPDNRAWREGWADLLTAADRIVAFSQVSVDILSRAYPERSHLFRVELRPHRPDLSHLRPVRRVASNVVTVGVIGNISRAKGSDVVHALAALVEARQLPMRIVVFGTLQSNAAASRALHVHGAFVPHDLPELLERYGVDVCLMPSVCPETYSFVTDEIMAMEMPLVVFGIGAPAERVARYTLGAVTTDITAEAALADIMRLAERATIPFA